MYTECSGVHVCAPVTQLKPTEAQKHFHPLSVFCLTDPMGYLI